MKALFKFSLSMIVNYEKYKSMVKKKLLIIILLFGICTFLNIKLIKNWIILSKLSKIKKVPIQNQNLTQIQPRAILSTSVLITNTLTAIKTTKNLLASTSLNNFDFSYLVNTDKNYCGKSNGKDLLFIAFVPVSPNLFEIRDLIRSTWASGKYLKPKAKIVFLLGRSTESSVNFQIKNESLKYADIVQYDFDDTFYNLTIKTIIGFKWVSSYCQNAKYTLKVDDDVVVNVHFLIEYLEGSIKKNKKQKNTIIGKCNKKRQVIRNINSRFFMSKDEFKDDYYKEYCEGPAYLLTTDLVPKMYYKSLNTNLIKFEDVYVGLLARNLSSTFVYINKYYRLSKQYNTYCHLKNETRLNENFFFYTDSARFKKVWKFLVKNL